MILICVFFFFEEFSHTHCLFSACREECFKAFKYNSGWHFSCGLFRRDDAIRHAFVLVSFRDGRKIATVPWENCSFWEHR